MREQYEAPQLTLIGLAEEVVLGGGVGGDDVSDEQIGWDFEFQPD